MGLFEQFPYTNFHELNLDWVLEQVKKLYDQTGDLKTAVEDVIGQVEEKTAEALQEMYDDGRLKLMIGGYVNPKFNQLSDAIDARVDDQDANIAAFKVDAAADIAAVDNRVTQATGLQDGKIEVLENRMDSFEALTPGSTTGDAELIDIRVPASGFHSGTNYSTAGDAVRGQVGDLKGMIDKSFDLLSGADSRRLANGTDFDSVTTAGNYTVPTYSAGSTMIHSPNPNSGRLIVFETSTSTRLYQLYFANTSVTNAVYWRCRYTDSTWTAWAQPALVAGDRESQVNKIRILSYNIGLYNYGISGGLSENVEEKIANYKRFFGDINPDFACIVEQDTYIDSGAEHESYDTLYKALFANKTLIKNHLQVLGNREMTGQTNLNIKDTAETDYGTFANIYLTTINGKTVPIVVVINRTEVDSDLRLSAFDGLLDWLEDNYDEHSIICGDFNPTNAAEFMAYVSKLTEAGFEIGNGGYFGDFETYTRSGFKKLDTVAVKGGKIKNLFVPQVYAQLSSDHLPMVADVEFDF